MHNGNDLLLLGGKNPTRYACRVASKLYGNELLSKRIVLPDSPERLSDREPLNDDSRVDTLRRKFFF